MFKSANLKPLTELLLVTRNLLDWHLVSLMPTVTEISKIETNNILPLNNGKWLSHLIMGSKVVSLQCT